jgi:hypothetical protein
MTRTHSTGNKKFSVSPLAPLMTAERSPFLHHFSFSAPKVSVSLVRSFDSLPARKFSFPGGAKWLQWRGWKEVHGGWKTNRTTPCFITASQSHFFPSHGRTSGLLPWERTGMWSHCARTQQREETACLYWRIPPAVQTTPDNQWLQNRRLVLQETCL